MYLHLLEVFLPAQRGYRHPARKPNVGRLTNLTTRNSMVFEFRHDPDDLFEKLPISRSDTLYIYNPRVVSGDMPIPDCVWPERQTLWQQAMDLNYSHVQLRALQALCFAQKDTIADSQKIATPGVVVADFPDVLFGLFRPLNNAENTKSQRCHLL